MVCGRFQWFMYILFYMYLKFIRLNKKKNEQCYLSMQFIQYCCVNCFIFLGICMIFDVFVGVINVIVSEEVEDWNFLGNVLYMIDF